MSTRIIGGALPSRAYQTTAIINATASVFNFTSTPIGTASARRHVIVAYRGTGVVTSCVIGGVTATALSTFGPSFFIAAVPTGTTATVTINVSVSTAHNITITVWSAYNLRSATATAVSTSTASPAALSLNVLGRGLVFGLACSGNTAGVTWTGAVEDVDQTSTTSNIPRSGASDVALTAGSPRTVTATYGGVPASPRAVAISLR